MAATEELYHQGYIGYPPLETAGSNPEFSIDLFASLGWGEFAEYAGKLRNNNGFQTLRAGQHDDKANPLITPHKACLLYTSPSPRDRG